MDLIQLYHDFLNESDNKDLSFEEFAQTRHDGAKKIADSAKAKGGPSMLTYHHFVVKLPYYKQAAEGKFDFRNYTMELDHHMNKLASMLPPSKKITQTEFQKIMGIIEVLGELIIRSKK
jgi:hypothetical protein